MIDSSREILLQEAKIGDMHGHHSAILGCKAPYSLKSMNYTTMMVLSLPSFHTLLQQHPKLLDRMYKCVRTDHSDPIQSFFMTRYDRISYFSNLEIKLVEELSYFLKVKIYEIN